MTDVEVATEVLRSYFACLEKYQFSSTTENWLKNNNPNWNWLSALTVLLHSEKSYHSLYFLETKRRQSRSQSWNMYEQAQREFKLHLGTLTNVASHSSRKYQSSSLSKLHSLSRLLSEILSLINIRLQMISVYKILAAGNNPPNLEEIEKTLSDILSLQPFTHPYLVNINLNLRNEIFTLQKLIQTHQQLSKHSYIGSILSLYSARTSLLEWKQRIIHFYSPSRQSTASIPNVSNSNNSSVTTTTTTTSSNSSTFTTSSSQQLSNNRSESSENKTPRSNSDTNNGSSGDSSESPPNSPDNKKLSESDIGLQTTSSLYGMDHEYHSYEEDSNSSGSGSGSGSSSSRASSKGSNNTGSWRSYNTAGVKLAKKIINRNAPPTVGSMSSYTDLPSVTSTSSQSSATKDIRENFEGNSSSSGSNSSGGGGGGGGTSSSMGYSLFQQHKHQPVSQNQQKINEILTKNSILLWLEYFCACTVEKSNLYFYSILQNQQLKNERLVLSSSDKYPINYLDRIENFVNKTNVYNLSVIVDAEHAQYDSNGYTCHLQSSSDGLETLTGLKAWPAVFSFPNKDQVYYHWPSVVCMIQDNTIQLNKAKEHYYFYDKKLQTTYFLSKVDLFTYLLLIYNEKKKNDTTITEFINLLSYELKNGSVWEQLKPAPKK